MTRKVNPGVAVGGAILLIAIALALIFRTAMRPAETVNDYSKIPPKGAGKFDRGDRGG